MRDPATLVKPAAKPRSDSRTSLVDKAYAHLKRLILDNKLRPGTVLLEQEVAALVGMSRTPARSAMERLAKDGLVEIRARHGMHILPISADDMREIYEVLTTLESQVAENVARKGASPHCLAELQRSVDDMHVALTNDDLEAWAAADERFHRALVDDCDNRRLRNLVYQFWDQSHRARMTTLRLRPKPVGSNKDHSELVAAIANRDPEIARGLHRAHRVRNGELLVNLLRDHGLRI